MSTLTALPTSSQLCTSAPQIGITEPATSFSSITTPTPRIYAEVGRYCVRMAESIEDRDAVCKLRFRVFNLELGEGLEGSYETGMDTDHFDLFCEHLLVEDNLVENPARRVVGTYRLQSGLKAAQNLGYYSELEFDFSPFQAIRPQILELGRASIDREHRTPEVLTLLWRGIAQYASYMGLRYLIGCSSLNSKDPAEGWQMYSQLEKHRVAPEYQTMPTEAYRCPIEHAGTSAQPHCKQTNASSKLVAGDPHIPAQPEVKIPKLLRTYLVIGARVCAPPAWDREFGTIDFLTLLDLQQLSAAARNRFLAPLTS